MLDARDRHARQRRARIARATPARDRVKRTSVIERPQVATVCLSTPGVKAESFLLRPTLQSLQLRTDAG
jgi:hypothetical protein